MLINGKIYPPEPERIATRLFGHANVESEAVWSAMNNRKKTYLFACTACNGVAYMLSKICYPLCPWCGARMGGKVWPDDD